MPPRETEANYSADGDRADNEDPGLGDSDPSNDDETERNDGAGFGARDREVAEGKLLGRGVLATTDVVEHVCTPWLVRTGWTRIGEECK